MDNRPDVVARRQAAVVEQVEELLASGVDVGNILKTLDTTSEALIRKLHRIGRHDLASIIQKSPWGYDGRPRRKQQQ